MIVLIVYGTNSGGTQDVAEIIGKVFSAHEHAVTIKRANEATADDIAVSDLVILGSCSWDREDGKQRQEGQLQEHMYAFANSLAGKTFPEKKFAVFGLGDKSYTEYCGAIDHLEDLVRKLQGQKFGDSLRLDGYFFKLPENQLKAKKWAETLEKTA
ncbi:MAG: flavodoxin family protein [Patescibacteria group bacterium]